MAFGSDEALYISIDRELQGHISADLLSCSIFKVPNHLRKINEMAYEPKVISIGPYHHGKDHLKKMEGLKKDYLKMLLRRNKEKTLKDYVEALKGLRENALAYYSEPPDQKDGGDQFVKMMLFDGCFVVELIRKSAKKELREENDPLFGQFILRTVMMDLLLIENQLPFFILMELFDMIKMPNENFMHDAINCFSIMMPGSCNKNIEGHLGMKHLLDLLHHSCLSPPEPQKGLRLAHVPDSASPGRFSPTKSLPSSTSSLTRDSELEEEYVEPLKPCSAFSVESSSSESPPDLEMGAASSVPSQCCIEDNQDRHCLMKLNDALFSAFKKLGEFISFTAKSEGHEEKNCNWQRIPSASELDEAGVKFEKVEGRLFDIKFEKGVMSIPILKMVEDTESILRNLVAYELCYKDISSRHFTDYIKFIDCLINKGKDVELLRRHEVIENRLGDDEVIANIFNRICDYVLIAEKDFFYCEIFNKVNKHCRKRCNRWKANLRHNYFNTPWASISVIAAVILLLLTVLQSVYSALAYHSQC